MPYNINRVVLTGRLTRDPELRALPSGTSVCHMRIACNASHRDADGSYQERPNFFDVSAFAGTAESVAEYMRKGRRVAIDGRLEWREWETPEHGKRQAVSIRADSVMFLDLPAGSDAEGELAGVGAGGEDNEVAF
jgi:single-strand DNA-binding protein